MTNYTRGVIKVTPEIKSQLINIQKKEKLYPWYTTPVGGEFLRALRATSGKINYPSKSVKNAGIRYEVSKVEYAGEIYALYRRVA